MRTLLLAPALFASEGGIERMMRLYLKALCELAGPQDEVVLAALNDAGHEAARLAAYSTPALRQQIRGSGARLSFTFAVLRTARQIDRVVCGHFNLWPLVALARTLNPRIDATLVAHGTEVWRPWTRHEQRSVGRTGRVLAVSEYTRTRVLERCPALPRSRTAVLPNALDPAVARRTDGVGAPGRIVTLARLSAADRYKGVDHLIRALPAVRQSVPAARLVVLGTGDDRPRLERLAADLAPGAVDFAGFVPDSDLSAQLSAAQLFALPSRDEGFGLVYLEAMAHGKPCVAARSAGAPEVVRDDCGELVDYGDIDGLAAACGRALRGSWDPDRLRARAAEFAYPSFRDRLGRLLQAAPDALPRAATDPR